jgi:RNA polymerase sigma-70 factor (ECF subfamily)
MSSDFPSKTFEMLLEAATRGSREALGELLQPFEYVLRARARRQLGDDLMLAVGATVVVQEVFVAAIEDFRHFRGGTAEEFKNWLLAILYHKITDFRKRCEAAKRDIMRQVALTPKIEKGLTTVERSEETSNIEEELKRDCMKQALAVLSTRYQQVITLRYLKGLTWGEIAARMERSEEAIKKLCERGLMCLQYEAKERFKVKKKVRPRWTDVPSLS